MTIISGTTSVGTTFTSATPKRLRFQLHYVSGGGTLTVQYGGSGGGGRAEYADQSYDSYLLTPTVTVPENLWLFLLPTTFIPVLLKRIRKLKKMPEKDNNL